MPSSLAGLPALVVKVGRPIIRWWGQGLLLFALPLGWVVAALIVIYELQLDPFSLFVIFLATMAVIAGLGWAMDRLISRPLGQLHRAIQAVAQGLPPDALDVQRRDEIGVVTAAFKAMAERLQRTQQALRLSEERLKLALDSGRIGAWDWDISAGQMHLSQRLAEVLWGCPGVNTIAPVEYLRRIHQDDQPTFRQFLDQHLAEVTSLSEVEYRLRHRDGDWRWMLCRIKVVAWDSAGQPTRMMGTHIDVTERHQREQELRQAQKMDAMGKLTGGIAHDFNNLLTVIQGNLELLADRDHDPARGTMVEDALSAVADGVDLTRSLLAFSRKQPLVQRTVAVAPLLAKFNRMVGRMLSEQVNLRTPPVDSTLAVTVDDGALEAALLNLVINAQDALPQGGWIELGAKRLQVPRPLICHGERLAPGRYVRLQVADNGEGMDEGVLQRACEPFFSTKADRGTGLGLAMVYGFARQSQGALRLVSQKGQGTRVELYLPLVVDVPVEAPRSRVKTQAAVGGTECILVVEDREDVRRFATTGLRQLGYRVLEAPHAAGAQTRLGCHPEVALVFSDIVMPGGMNGYDLAHWVAARPNPPALLLTTGFSDGAEQGGQRRFPAPVLPKPYSIDQLDQYIRLVLDYGS